MSYHQTAMLGRACGVWSRLPSPDAPKNEVDGDRRSRDSFLHRGSPMRSAVATSPAAPALLLLVALVGGCFVDYDFDNTSFACADGTCPSGYQCVAERCVQPTSGGDAGSGGADASASADAAPTGDDAAVQLATCDEQFGASTGYQLCIEAETTCEFFHLAAAPEACADVCALYGATCITTFNATEGTECTREEEAVCTTTRSSQICICSRGDGLGG